MDRELPKFWSKKLIWGALVIIVLLVGILYLHFRKTAFPITENFCGSSSFGKCALDKDCVAGGCSGQTCQSANEGADFSICEWRDCYDAKKYNLKCRCIENKCQWSKVNH